MQHKVLIILSLLFCIIPNACDGNEIVGPTAASNPTQSSIPLIKAATGTSISTVTSGPTSGAFVTATPGYFPVFEPHSPGDGHVCGEYTPVPQWHPVEFEPVAYVRILALDENIGYDPVVLELGIFVKPGELKEADGRIVYSYPRWNDIFTYSVIYLWDAPIKVQEALKRGDLIASMEIVDLQNNHLPYRMSDQSIQDITFMVDDLIPYPLLDEALPCSSFVDGHAISHVSSRAQEP